jgi:hypothetical protein
MDTSDLTIGLSWGYMLAPLLISVNSRCCVDYFLGAHGFFAAQGFLPAHGFFPFAAHGFLAAQGFFAAHGFLAAHGLPFFDFEALG